MKLPGVTEQVNNVPFRKTFFFYMTLSPPIFPEKLLLCCFSVKLIPSRIFIQCMYVTEVSELVKVSEFFFFTSYPDASDFIPVGISIT